MSHLIHKLTSTPAASSLECTSEAEGRPQAHCITLSRSLCGRSTLAAQSGHCGQAPRASAMSALRAAASATCSAAQLQGQG